jgi:uncharacterized cupredoxin-like copper-binding protein
MRVPSCIVLALAAFLAVVVPGRAAADGKFHTMPASAKVDRGKLQVKVVRYDGSTNGELTVQVKNTSKTATRFSARGLYFVPDGDPDQAPQRLGAVGPFQIATDRDDAEKARRESLTLAPGATVELTLDVFCIDSHRSSPSAATPFTVGKSRMPASLAVDIDRKAKVAAEKAGGFAAPAARSEVQSAVWATRDADWIRLDGEGDQESGK